jgi:Uma2 family endonuclease
MRAGPIRLTAEPQNMLGDPPGIEDPRTMRQGDRWARVVKLTRILVRAVGDRVEVRVQLPMAIGDSEPEPDLAVVPAGDYLDHHPGTAGLVIEVADSSLEEDRTVKARLYAEASVPEYWIVDLQHKLVERYLAPRDGRYTQLTTHGPGETLGESAEALSGVTVALAEILPR